MQSLSSADGTYLILSITYFNYWHYKSKSIVDWFWVSTLRISALHFLISNLVLPPICEDSTGFVHERFRIIWFTSFYLLHKQLNFVLWQAFLINLLLSLGTAEFCRNISLYSIIRFDNIKFILISQTVSLKYLKRRNRKA